MKLVSSLFLLFCISAYANACNKAPREVRYHGQIIDVFVSKDALPTNISLPEKDILGGVEDQGDGIEFLSDEGRYNRFAIKVSREYNGMIFIDGLSGETYKLNVIYNQGCADRLVEVKKGIDFKKERVSTNDPLRATLMQVLWHAFDEGEELPPGYRKISFRHIPRAKRLVMEEGKMKMYYDTVYEGDRYVGHIFEIVNTGREAYYFDYDAIDFTDPKMMKSLGLARELSMIPADRVLDPAPEFVEDVYSNQSIAFFYVVSEVKNNGR